MIKIESVYVGIIQKFHKSFPGEELSKDVIFNEVRKLKEGKRIADEEMPEYIRKFALGGERFAEIRRIYPEGNC